MATEAAAVEYFDRLVMEADLYWMPTAKDPPPDVTFLPWKRELLDVHADLMAQSFGNEPDARLFRRLGFVDGCRAVMQEITQHLAFSASATWLAMSRDTPVGCIQGIRRDWKVGAIQNLAVAPRWQGRGIGRALLAASCRGFRQEGLRYAILEVTADNKPAVSLYHQMGFIPRRRFLRAAEVRKVE
jgi:ribosomal protein S18 acetylase RimI-like enzyme